MKFEDLKLVQKWREYAGPKDERLEAENAKIYKIGFMLLSFGMLMILFYEILARQVAWVHSDASESRISLQRQPRRPCMHGLLS